MVRYVHVGLKKNVFVSSSALRYAAQLHKSSQFGITYAIRVSLP